MYYSDIHHGTFSSPENILPFFATYELLNSYNILGNLLVPHSYHYLYIEIILQFKNNREFEFKRHYAICALSVYTSPTSAELEKPNKHTMSDNIYSTPRI